MMVKSQRDTLLSNDDYDVIVVGAGFAGMYLLHRLRELGLSVRVFEQGADVGGTWYWNRYPGARCDIESMQYSYSFSNELQQEWEWTERYASQPEILKYANHVADRFNLRSGIQFNASVTSAVFEEHVSRWTVTTADGKRISAQYVVLATGGLSNARTPDFEGSASFKGKTYHTGHWPHEGVDFTGLRVGVIGTGSSAIQLIPKIAAQAKHLTVFQRTPSFSIPAQNRDLTPDDRKQWKDDYQELRRRAREQTRNGTIGPVSTKRAFEDSPAARREVFDEAWSRGDMSFLASYKDLLLDTAANDTAADYVREKIAQIVRDPQVAKLLQPTTYPIGTKRICLDSGYYQTFNRENVALVDIRNAPIERMTPNGLIAGGTEYKLDAIVFATGYDAMTGSFLKIDIRGRGGLTLGEKWAEGPKTYLGLMVGGFPNLFFMAGPGSPSALTNMIVSIEQHVDWVAECLSNLREKGFSAIEATSPAEDRWVAHVNELASKTLFPQANSWYMGANIPGKPRVFMPYLGGVQGYRETCNNVAANNYEGFALSPENVRSSTDEREAVDGESSNRAAGA